MSIRSTGQNTVDLLWDKRQLWHIWFARPLGPYWWNELGKDPFRARQIVVLVDKEVDKEVWTIPLS